MLLPILKTIKILQIIQIFFTIYPNAVYVKADTECPTTLINPQNRIANKSTLTIMQYNVEWLFIDYCKSANCPGEGCAWSNSSESETHLQYVAKIIQEVNPDIINLCEVEGCDELNILANTLDLNYLPYLKKGTDTSTGQNVGMITRVDPLIDLYRTEERVDYPINGSKCGYTGSNGTSGVSKHYITEYKFGEHNIAFIGAHFVAYPTEPSRCVQREAQAQVIQNIIHSYYNKNYEIIVVGDFNDFDNETLDANNNHPISQTLNILKGNYGVHKGTYQLFNAAELINKNDRFTCWWDSNNNCISTPTEFSMIDHILISPALKEKITDAYIYHNYDEFCGTYNSDHYPVIITLSL